MPSLTKEQAADFEQKLRTEIVNAAYSLHKSGMSFAIFANTRCNPDYWTRTSNGGWRLNPDAAPSDAVRDIFGNGYRYATECATAMGIVYYKAVLEVYGDELFDRTFTSIYLMDWDIRDPLLNRVGYMESVSSLVTGDRAYFANPDHSPELPQWQGENVIVLGDGAYYGHGIGINSAEHIVKSLNSKRFSGNPRPAYLMSSAGRPDFAKLARVMSSESAVAVWKAFPPAVSERRAEAKNGFVHISGERMFV
jgi:protein-glutamine gamma-glutamyltransferase